MTKTNKAKKVMLLAGSLCVMSLAVCACGKEKDTAEVQQKEAVIAEPEENTEEDTKEEQTAADTEGAGAGTVNGKEDQPSAESASGGIWSDSAPNLEGDIKELKDGQLTVIEVIQEKTEDGGAIMVGPSSGGDGSGFNQILVTYDQNTLVKIQTIYDGGARFEMSEAAASDMAEGQFVRVWGSSSGGSLNATQICIVKTDGIRE